MKPWTVSCDRQNRKGRLLYGKSSKKKRIGSAHMMNSSASKKKGKIDTRSRVRSP